MDQSERVDEVPEEEWAREIERIRAASRRTLRFAALPPHGMGKKAGLVLGLGALTGNVNEGAHAGSILASNGKDDIGGNIIRSDRCCLCGLNTATETHILKTKIENMAGMLLGGPLLGEQTVGTAVGYCTRCEEHVKGLPGINLASYMKVGGTWRLTLTFLNDRVAREYFRLNIDRVMDPLHAATNVGDVEEVLLLLDAGWPADVRDAIGKTPLHVAAEFGNTEIAEVLLTHGADANALSAKRRTPAMFAASYPEIQELLRRYAEDGAGRVESNSGHP